MVEVAVEQGLDAEAVVAALKDPSVKDLVRREVDRSLELGVFGSPYFFVDGEPFWGHDRMPEIDEKQRMHKP